MTGEDLKSLSRGTSADMSPEAIARRLDIAAELYDLAMALGRADYVGKAAGDNGVAVDDSRNAASNS